MHTTTTTCSQALFAQSSNCNKQKATSKSSSMYDEREISRESFAP